MVKRKHGKKIQHVKDEETKPSVCCTHFQTSWIFQTILAESIGIPPFISKNFSISPLYNIGFQSEVEKNGLQHCREGERGEGQEKCSKICEIPFNFCQDCSELFNELSENSKNELSEDSMYYARQANYFYSRIVWWPLLAPVNWR